VSPSITMSRGQRPTSVASVILIHLTVEPFDHNRPTLQTDRTYTTVRRHRANSYWATVCKTVRPMLSDRCLSVCDVRALWPNGWTDQDETWHAGRLGPGHIVLDGDPDPHPPKGHSPPIFGPSQ